MKITPWTFRTSLLNAALLTGYQVSAFAAEIPFNIPALTDTQVTTPGNWLGGVAPTSADVATWLTDVDPVTAGNQESRGGSLFLSSPVSWLGLRHEDSVGPLTLSGSDITLGASGITEVRFELLNIQSNVTLGASQTWTNTVTTTVSGNVSGGFGITKSGAGNLVLSGANTFTGPVSVTLGTLTATSLNSVSGGTPSSSLGAPLTIADGTISLGSGNQGALAYTGPGETTDRVINLSGTTGGATLTADTTGTLVFSSPTTVTGSGAKGVTINGGGNGQISGFLHLGGLTNITKNGAGTWTFTGNSTQDTGALNVNGGVTAFASTASRSGGAITRSLTGGGVLKIASGSNIATTSANTNGILGGWALVDNSTWAVANGASAISGLATYTSDTWAIGNNTDVTVAGANPATASTTHTLRFNQAGAKTLTLDGINTLTGGGILLNPVVGVNETVITGGTLAGSASSDLAIHQNNSAGGLTIGSVIANNTAATTLTKTGPGLLTLTAANSYTGNTYVLGGELVANATNGAKNYILSQGTTLRLGYGTATSGYGHGVTVHGTSAGTAATSGVYFNGGSTYNLQSSLSLQTAPSRVRAHGTGSPLLHGWDTNGTHLIVSALASGSIIDPEINFAPGSYGYVMNVAPGANTATGDLIIGGALTGATNANSTHFRKVGTGSVVFTGSSSNGAPLDIRAGTAILRGGDDRLGIGAAVFLGNGTGSGKLVLDGIKQRVGNLTTVGTGTTNMAVGGSATLSTLTVAYSGAGQSFGGTLGGSGTNENNLAFEKAGTGTYTLTGNNTHTGGTIVTEGVLSLGSAGALGTTGTISLNGGTLQFSAANTTDYLARLRLEDNVAGTIDTNGQNITFASALPTGESGTGGLTKAGAGTLTLGGTNTYIGATTVAAGTLKLDYTGTNTSKIANGSSLVLAGGSIELAGGSHVEVVNSTELSAPGTVTITRSSGASVLNLGFVFRTGTGTLDLAAAGIARTSLTNDGSGKLPAWITVAGQPAAVDGSGNIIAFAGFNDVVRLGGKLPNDTDANVRIVNGGTTGDITPLTSGLSDISTLLQNANAGPAVIALDVADTVRLGENGAILVPATSGALTIQGGALTAGGLDDVPGEIAVDADGEATFATAVLDNGEFGPVTLTKAGSGSLALAASNAHTGGTILIDGVLRVNHSKGMGLAPFTILGGSLDNTSGIPVEITDTLAQTWDADFGYVGTGNLRFGPGTATVTGNRTVTVTAGELGFGGTVTGAFNLTKTGAGTLFLGTSGMTGTTTITEGVLEVQGRANGDAPYVIGTNGTLKIRYTTGGAYAATSLQINGAGVAATTGLYLEGGTSYNTSGLVQLLGAPTTIRHFGNGLAGIGHFDINGTGLSVSAAASGSVIDSNIEFVSRGYGMSVDIATGANTATGDLVMNGPLNINAVGFGLYKRGPGSITLNAPATAENAGVKIQGGSVITGVANALGENAELPVSAGAKLVMNGFSQAAATLSGAGQVANGGATPATLTIKQGSDQTFSGVLGGAGANEPAFALVKTGPAKLTLSGANNYTGSTTVDSGTLAVTTAFFADGADVILGATASLDLATAATDVIDELIVNGVGQAPGIYGAVGSGAQFERAYLTGTGKLSVTTGGDGGDYAAWEIANGIAGAGANVDSDGDGVLNGIEFVIGGIPAGPGSNSTHLLPTLTVDGTYLNFVFRRMPDAASYDPYVEYGSTLAGWTEAMPGQPEATPVIIDEVNGALPTDPDIVTVRIPKALAIGSKMFARLRVDIP